MINQPPGQSQDDVIRITREEALGAHTDSLIQRQMNMRGIRGGSRERRAWYYQNWFVFMVVGGLAGLTAGAIIEPFFDDLTYWQGTVQSITPGSGASQSHVVSDGILDPGAIEAWVTIRDQRICLLQGTQILTNEEALPLTLASLYSGREIGVYVDTDVPPEYQAPVASFVVLDPKPQSAYRESLSFDWLVRRASLAGLCLFPLVAGLVGLAIGAVEGIICRLPSRALLAGAVGLFVGLLGGLVSGLLAGLVYIPINYWAMSQAAYGLAPLAFTVQMGGRGLAWALAGTAMGLGQGLALRSTRLFVYGILGGIIGGLIGGLLFDPIDLLLLGPDKPSAHVSRLMGLTVVGLCVGAMIGIVELMARDAWLRMTEGPLAGKEFLLFRDVMNIGASPRSELYLFNDPSVGDTHAVIRTLGSECELSATSASLPVFVNDRPVTRARLRHGDRIAIGRTAFLFQKRQG